MKKQKIKKFLIDVYSWINEVAIWFVFSIGFILSVSFAYVFPEYGIDCLLISIAFTVISRIGKSYKKEEE